MNINIYLLLGFVFAVLLIIVLVYKLYHIYEQISFIKDVLKDLKAGNLNRRILVQENDITKQICYDINQIAINNQSQLIRQKQSEQAYKRLMTSLSHDVKTPLSSLSGYLEAIENKIVVDKEKDEYIHVAFEKSQHLKQFVENLFEWVKLDSGEQVFHFEQVDLNELTRYIIADWVLILENNHFEYDVDIPEKECLVRLDVNAYTRIINNLLQNIIVHSEGNKMTLQVLEDQQRVQIVINDNGKGIASDSLLQIFERLYQCDNSRSAKGNGLGLAITKELVNAHKGTITATSVPNVKTEFLISFPKAL